MSKSSETKWQKKWEKDTADMLEELGRVPALIKEGLEHDALAIVKAARAKNKRLMNPTAERLIAESAWHVDDSLARDVKEAIDHALSRGKDGETLECLIELELAADRVKRYGFSGIKEDIEHHIDVSRRYLENKYENQMHHSSRLIDEGKVKDAVDLLNKVRAGATRAHLEHVLEKVNHVLSTMETVSKLINLFSVARRLKIDDACAILGKKRKEMLPLFAGWANKGHFKIDGEYLVADEDTSMDSLSAELDKQFALWASKGKSKDGKI